MAYSDGEIAEALVKLAVNKYDFAKTSQDTGVPIFTLRRWNKKVPKKGIADLLERAIQRLLMAIPSDMNGQNWAVALGILLDKWLLVQGKATARTENISHLFDGYSKDELDDLLAEADRIIAENGGGANQGGGAPGE